MPFDPQAARRRLSKLWELRARFGVERNAYAVYLEEIVSDRYALVNGLQLLRDELQFSSARRRESDVSACGADFSLPSVVTTLAHTNCGDRIHQGGAMAEYRQVVASRFATISEIGEVKLEAFFPTGGGTDDGATLAHVTVGHQLDETLKRHVYEGNAQSFVLASFDLKTHVGRLDEGGTTRFGQTAESPWREPRSACGAIVGTLAKFNGENAVHRRIRADLGEENFAFLSSAKLLTPEGIDITAAVAAAIVAVRGMRNTLRALVDELDERGVGHATASITVNRLSQNDTLIYLARGTIFDRTIRTQGLGLDARRYGGKLIDHGGEKRLVLVYDGCEGDALPIETDRLEHRGPRTKRYVPLLEEL
jgi:hypothetical protein